jgi:phosphatidylinositol phospholipase C delta
VLYNKDAVVLNVSLSSSLCLESQLIYLLTFCLLTPTFFYPVDCWDGSDGEPIIYHGHTLTSKIKFKDVIDTVKKYAFVTTPYPLILSIENHCTTGQQAIMGIYMQNTLGDMMIKGDPDVMKKALPSPEELRGKILVKGAKLPFEQNAKVEEIFEEDEDEEDEAATKKPKKAITLAKDLSDCITYCKTTGFKGFDQASGKYWEMSSFSEAKANKLASSATKAFIDYNRLQLSRIFPAGGRVDSSNYDPTTTWSGGCQIVALNYQTPDRPMQLNEIKFKVNAKAGYILKPAYMRGLPSQPTPVTLTFKLFSGQRLPKPVGSEKSADVIDPYVEIEVSGVNREKSKVKRGGFSPQWGGETFSFTIPDVESALLRVAVYDKENIGADRFIGYWGAPVAAIRTGRASSFFFILPPSSLSPSSSASYLLFLTTGYRHLYLQHGNGHPLGNATLFCFLGLK